MDLAVHRPPQTSELASRVATCCRTSDHLRQFTAQRVDRLRDLAGHYFQVSGIFSEQGWMVRPEVSAPTLIPPCRASRALRAVCHVVVERIARRSNAGEIFLHVLM